MNFILIYLTNFIHRNGFYLLFGCRWDAYQGEEDVDIAMPSISTIGNNGLNQSNPITVSSRAELPGSGTSSVLQSGACSRKGSKTMDPFLDCRETLNLDENNIGIA